MLFIWTGQEYFGIQYYGECWGGEEADLSYDQYGSNPAGCYNNMVGKAWHNFVYKFNSEYKDIWSPYSSLENDLRPLFFPQECFGALLWIFGAIILDMMWGLHYCLKYDLAPRSEYLRPYSSPMNDYEKFSSVSLVVEIYIAGAARPLKYLKGVSFKRNCGAASVGENNCVI